jgi:hypothetical protein
MTLVWVFALCALIAIALISIVNTLTFPRLRQAKPARTPFVSLLIPARDEADVIGGSVSRLLSQIYPRFEVVVLDDGSTDGTREQACQAAASDSRFRVIGGEPLPDGWLGKNWACHQLAGQAKGEILIFTDADVRWGPQALSAVIHLMDKTRADTFTVLPTQETRTWGERLVVPMMMFVIMGYLPELCVRYIPWPVFAAANGQCLAFRRDAYQHIGGHAAVRANVVEDVGLAWETKRKGSGRLRQEYPGRAWWAAWLSSALGVLSLAALPVALDLAGGRLGSQSRIRLAMVPAGSDGAGGRRSHPERSGYPPARGRRPHAALFDRADDAYRWPLAVVAYSIWRAAVERAIGGSQGLIMSNPIVIIGAG